MVRTLIILVCGITMALAAYAGQAGYPGERSRETELVQDIRLKELDGYLLSYQAVSTPGGQAKPGPNTRSPARLLLRVENPAGELVGRARVRFTVEAPQGRRIQVRAQPEQKGFAADVGWQAPGPYQILTEVTVGSVVLEDTFLCRLN